MFKPPNATRATSDEIIALREEAKNEYHTLLREGGQDYAVHVAAFQAKVEERQRLGPAASRNRDADREQRPYAPRLGMGRRSMPLDPERFVAKHSAEGFPSTEDVDSTKEWEIRPVDAKNELAGNW